MISSTSTQDPRRTAYIAARKRGLDPNAALAEADSVVANPPSAGQVASQGNTDLSALLPALQSYTMGTADNLAGLGAAVIPGGMGYTEGRNAAQGAINQAREETGAAGGLSELLAAFLPGPGLVGKAIGAIPKIGKAIQGSHAVSAGGDYLQKGVKGVAGRATARGTQGAVGGGIQGLAEAETAAGGQTGGAWGAMAGVLLPPLIQKGLRATEWGGRLLGNAVSGGRVMTLAQKNEEKAALRLLHRDVLDYAGKNPTDLISAMDAENALVPDHTYWNTIADAVDSPNIQSAIRAAASVPGKAQEVYAAHIAAQAGGQNLPKVKTRLVDTLERLWGTKSRGVKALADHIKTERSRVADPVYEAVKSSGEVVDDPSLQVMLKNRAIRTAHRIGQHALAGSEKASKFEASMPSDPFSYGEISPGGTSTTPKLPTVKDLYFIKIGLDDEIDRLLRNATNEVSERGGSREGKAYAVNKLIPLRTQVEAILSASSQEYVDANRIWGGYAGLLQGLKGGTKAANLSPDDITFDLLHLPSDAAKDMYRATALKTLRARLNSSGNPETVLANTRTQQQLAALFGDDPTAMETLIQAVQTSATQAGTRTAMTPGGTSGMAFRDLLRQQSGSVGLGMRAAQKTPWISAWAVRYENALTERIAERFAMLTTKTYGQGAGLTALLKQLTPIKDQTMLRRATSSGQVGALVLGPPGTSFEKD